MNKIIEGHYRSGGFDIIKKGTMWSINIGGKTHLVPSLTKAKQLINTKNLTKVRYDILRKGIVITHSIYTTDKDAKCIKDWLRSTLAPDETLLSMTLSNHRKYNDNNYFQNYNLRKEVI